MSAATVPRPAADRASVPGGVIAFVGSEATGKSTLLEAAQEWLGDRTVVRIHAGKPPATVLTFVPHVLLPAMRRLFPRQRLTTVEARYREPAAPGDAFPLLFGVRAVMLAYERAALLRRARTRADDGAIVLSDRYPSTRAGAPDGPQLGDLVAARRGLRAWLAAVETRLYERIPPPTLVIHLTAPLDVTLARNAARGKVEPEEYVRRRHAMSERLAFDGIPVHRVDTARPLEDVLEEVKDAIRGAR